MMGSRFSAMSSASRFLKTPSSPLRSAGLLSPVARRRHRAGARDSEKRRPKVTTFPPGIVLGYLLDPFVLKLQKFGFSRLGASLLILTVFVLTVVLFFILVVPVLGGQFIAFAQHLPSYAMRLQSIAVEEGNALIAKYGGHWLDAFGLRQQLSSAQIQKSVGDFVAQSAQWLLAAFTRLVHGGAAVFDFLSLSIVTPVVAFYILIDWHRMIAKLDSWLPLDHRENLRKIAREINHALARFIRGQSIVCLFQDRKSVV